MYMVDMDKLSVASEQELHSLQGKAISVAKGACERKLNFSQWTFG